jgi:hypothetical protein
MDKVFSLTASSSYMHNGHIENMKGMKGDLIIKIWLSHSSLIYEMCAIFNENIKDSNRGQTIPDR